MNELTSVGFKLDAATIADLERIAEHLSEKKDVRVSKTAALRIVLREAAEKIPEKKKK